MSQPIDESHHFQLKPITAEHLQSMSDWYQNIDELALIESHLPLPVNSKSLENLWKRDIDQKAPRTSYLYSICNATDEPVGFTGLQDLNLTYGSGVVFIFVEANHRGHGLAIRAIALILDMAFHQLRLHRITTFVHCENQSSLDLVKRVGFSDEGCMRESSFFGGKYHNVNLVGLLAPEWQAHRTALNDTLDGNTRISIGHNGDKNWSWPLT